MFSNGYFLNARYLIMAFWGNRDIHLINAGNVVMCGNFNSRYASTGLILRHGRFLALTLTHAAKRSGRKTSYGALIGSEDERSCGAAVNSRVVALVGSRLQLCPVGSDLFCSYPD